MVAPSSRGLVDDGLATQNFGAFFVPTHRHSDIPVLLREATVFVVDLACCLSYVPFDNHSIGTVPSYLLPLQASDRYKR